MRVLHVKTIGQVSYVASTNQVLALQLVAPNASTVQQLHFAVYSICPGWDCLSPPAAHFQAHSCSWNHYNVSIEGQTIN